MITSRRSFLASAAAVATAAPALRAVALLPAVACASASAAAGLRADPEGALDLPDGFTYQILSRTGDRMSDGLREPAAHDGMACFPVAGDPDRCLLVRNHEMRPGQRGEGAFEDDAPALGPDRIYDRDLDGRPLLGGTTTLLVNVREMRVERSHLSLAGTLVNCAGGPTPWGSWLSCEETEELPGRNARRPHGFVFEVPATGTGLAAPVPLTAMGRFRHEAAAVDPLTGVVYLTEDQEDGLFYRFLPAAPRDLAKGGRLQALALADERGADLTNWRNRRIREGEPLPARWVDLEEVTAPKGDLRYQGREKGAAIFARGEGMSVATDARGVVIYFACTTGGPAKTGQVFRYRAGPTPNVGALELFVESRGADHFDMVDNIVAAPWGDLILCEDGAQDNYVRAVTPDGRVYAIARNAMPGKSEFAGACFSPDGSTLFVNAQRPGVTFAIRGPWEGLRSAGAAPA